MRGEEPPHGNHLGMRGRVLLLVPQIAPARQHLAIAHNRRTEEIRIVAERRLLQGDTHEALVRRGRGRLDASAERGRDDRQRRRAERAGHQMTATDAGGRRFRCVLHAFAPLHGRGAAPRR